MTIQTKCDFGDEVYLLAGGDKIVGRVVSFWRNSTGLQYEVVFWNNGKREKEYFLESEIEFKVNKGGATGGTGEE